MAGDELPEPVAEKTASHEAINLQAINDSISTENLKEQMDIKSNVLNVNTVNKDGDMVKEEEEVPYKLGIREQNQIITEKPESSEKFTLNLEQEIPKTEETSLPVEKPNAEEQDKVNGETENEVHTTQFSEELSPVVQGDEIPLNGTPLLSEEIQEKTDSEEVTKEIQQNQISDEDETEKDAVQRSSVATVSDNDNQKELEIPIENASENPEDVINEVDVPSSTTPLVANEVLEEASGKYDVSEEAQKEQMHQIETPKKDLAEEKECRDETEDQSKNVPLATSSEETIPEETSQENQAPEMTCEEIERNEESTFINEMDKTSRLDNEETIPDEMSTSYDQSIASEESSKRDEEPEHMSEDVKVDDLAETAIPLISEVAKGCADIKEDETEEAHQNQKKISNEDGTDKDAGQSTSVIELSESDDQNETVKPIEKTSTNPEEEVIKELNLKEDESPSSVQEESLEEAKEKVDVVEMQNEQNFEEVKLTEDNIAMGEKEKTTQNENEENAEDLTSSHQAITNEETGKINEDSEHISDESTLDTVTTRDVAPEIIIKDAEIKALTSETESMDIEKIKEENEEISVEVGPSESSDATMKIEEASLNDCKEEKSEEHEKLKYQETNEEQEVESCLETKEQLDESKPSPSEEEVCAEKDIVETKPLNETEEGDENLAQNEIPSESTETNTEDKDEICDEKSKGADGDQLAEIKSQDNEAVEENIEEISDSTEASNDIGALIDTEISSENTVSSQLITNEEVELQNENTLSSQLTTSEEVLPEVPSESTTISQMEKEDKRNEVLHPKTENMEVVSSHEDEPNKNSEAEGSAEVTEAPEEDRKDRISERSYEQDQDVPEKTTEEDDLTISSDGNEITEKPEIANASSQGQEENSVLPQKDDESVLEVKSEEETKAEILEKFLPEKATEEDGLTIASNDNEIATEKPESSEALSQGQDDKSVIPNDDESVLEVNPEEETKVEILENEQITQKLEEVDEPCITQSKEEIPEAESAIESKKISTDSSISTIQEEKQSEESQFDERSIAKEKEVITQAENTVVETPDEETEGETEKQIEEIPQITAPSGVTEVELGQSETLASGTENFEVISNEKSGDDTKFTDVDAQSAELESPTDESLAQEETSVETSNAREVQIDGTELEVKQTEPDQAADEVSAAENSEDNAKLSASVGQIGEVEGLVVDDGKDKNSVIPQNVDEPALEVKSEEENKDETMTNEKITQILEVDKEPCITQNKEELPKAENIIENKETSTNSGIITLQGDQQSEESDAKPSDATQATDIISEEVEQISERSIAKEEETTTKEENIIVETRKEKTEGESTEEQIEEISEMTDPSEVTEVELSQSEIVGPETEELEVVSNEKFGEESELTDAHSKSTKLESTIDELIEGKETCVEQFDERSITKEEEATIQEHNVVVETQKGEAEGESTEENMKQIPEITSPSEITEIKISQSKTVAPEIENVEVVSNEKFEDESKSIDLESTIGESTELKEISTEPNNTREMQIEIENITVSDQLIQESDVKLTEVEQATDEVFAIVNSDDNVTLSASVEQIGVVEESIAKDKSVSLHEEDDAVVKMPEEEVKKIEAANKKQMEEEIPQITNPSEVNEVELNQSEIVAPETENMEAIPYEKSGNDTKLIDTYSKSAELKITTDKSTEHDEISTQPINTREVQIDQTVSITEQDELNQVSDKNPTKPEKVTYKVSEVDYSEINATLSASIEHIGEDEGLVANTENSVLQEESIVAEMPKEEADQKVEATNEKKIEEISEITGPSDIIEIKTSQTETVAPETENLEVVSNEKFDDERKPTEIDENLADLESKTGESTEQNEISTELSNSREVQPEHENITVQDQLSQESDVKPTKVDQATDDVCAVAKSEDNATLSATTEQIGEIEESIAKEESVSLQEEDDVVAKISEEEALKTKAENEKQMKEEISQIVHSSDVNEVELSQTEVAPEIKNTEVVSDDKFSAETELTDTYSKSAELTSITDKIATEPINTREVQIDQTETIIEQEQLKEVSDTKPSEPDQVMDKVARVENSKVNAISSTSIEPTGEAEGLIATEESVILQEKDAVVEIPEEKANQELEATDEKYIEKVPLIVHPSEVTEHQLVESDPVGTEAEHSEIVSDQKFGDESEFGETDLKSDQMETMVEKPNAHLSSSVEHITERSEENEGLLKVTGEQVQGKKTDAIEVVEESTDKHIDGEFRRTGDSEIYDTADEEMKTISTEKEVNPPIFETPTESPEQEKETEESVLAEEKSDTVTLVAGEGQIEETESANKESCVLLQSTTELPEQKVSQAVETHEEPSDKDIAGEISEIIHPNEITEVQLVESETLHPETVQLEIRSNETLGDESKLDETVVKLAQMETSDEIIEEKLNANLSSSGEQICEKSEESEVVLQRTDELVRGEKIDAEVPKEETSRGIEVAEVPCDKHIEGQKPDAEMVNEEDSQGIEIAEDPCDKHIEGQIHRTPDPEICYAAEESKDVLTENEVVNFGNETESTEKTTEESASVENSDATAILVPDEGHVEVESANRERSVVPQSTTESVAVPEERVPLENDTGEEQSDKDIVGEMSKIASLETHDGAVQSEIMLNEEKVDSDELRTEIESPDLENATKESTFVEEKSDNTASFVHSEGQIEEIEIASKESRVSPESTIESFTVPEENVTEGIETNEEPSDKHIVEEQDNTLVDNLEASEDIHLVQEDKVDQAQTTASSVEHHDSKNDGIEMESAFLKNTNDGIDVKENLDASVISIVEEQGAVINRTDNGSESVPTVEETHCETTELIDEKILSDVPPETLNSTETEKLHVKEDALDTVISEPEDQTKDEDLMTQSQEEISGQDKDIANITSEAVSGEVNTDTTQKGGDQHMENSAGQEAIEQTERDIDVRKLLNAAEKVEADEPNEVSRQTMPDLSEPSKEVEEEAEQSEGPEQDFASIVSSFLISKVLSDENQKVDDGLKQNNDASSIPKPLDGETIQEIAATKTEPETEHEEMLYGTSAREEAKLQIQEPEEENGEKTVEENGEEDGVEHDYLPVSRFLMDKILRQEENKNLPEEKTIEETDTHPVNDSGIQVEEKIEETDKDLVNDGGNQVDFEENSHIVLAPEQKGETTFSFAELPRDFEKGETLIGKVQSTFAGDGAIFIVEKVEENSAVAEYTKIEGEGSHSPIEVASDFEKEEKLAEAPKPTEDKNETLVSDVVISSVEKVEGENSSGVVVEQEGESISPTEALRDFEKENKIMEQKNEVLITDEGISSIENIVENAGDVALPKQGEKTSYPGNMATDFGDKKPSEEKDDTMVSFDEVKEGGNSKVAFEEVEDSAYREHSKDLIEEALINVQEISNSEEVIEENRTLGTHKEEEQKNEVVVDEETPKDVKNVEENYVFVEHEANQLEEPKEILEEEKVADGASDATVSNMQEKQTNLSDGMENAKTNLVGQVEISEKGMKNSSVSYQDIEQSPADIPKVPMATEIVKVLDGNETEFIHGEEHVKEVTDAVVDSTENRSQEKLAEIEGTKIEKKSEDIKSEEHEEEEEEEEEERHQEKETEIIGRDLTVKGEARETEMKSAQKKSHNILSGVGSKVKHSFAKVKKAITGKSKNVSPSAK